MDGIDPLRGGIPFQGLPMTDEISLQVKKKLKENRMETADPETAEASDLSNLSPEAAKLARPQFEAFLESAKDTILNMDRNSETFTQDATQRLVSSALERKFGDKFKDDPGYPDMEKKLTSTILNDPESRNMIEEFLELIHMEQGGG